MTDNKSSVATPQLLYEWCNKVMQKLRPSFLKNHERHRLLFHYPSVDALLYGTLQQRCHVCSILACW